MLTQARLHELLIYNHKTGIFRHRKSRGNRKAFDVAGCKDKYGYILIGIDGKMYLGHHLAWFYVYGVWPDEIDHKDLVPDYNAIDNLRLSTRSQNQAHRNTPANNTSGYRGVVKSPTPGKWIAQSKDKGKAISFGTWPTIQLAAAAYNIGMKRRHGEYFTPQNIQP